MTHVVWGPGYGSAPPPSPRMGQDPFAEAERDTRAMVAAQWWPSAPPQQRHHAIAGRMLVLPDGTFLDVAMVERARRTIALADWIAQP